MGDKCIKIGQIDRYRNLRSTYQRVINTYTDHNMYVKIIPKNDGIKSPAISGIKKLCTGIGVRLWKEHKTYHIK